MKYYYFFLQFAFSAVTRVSAKRGVLLIILSTCIYSNFSRCELELKLNPAQAVPYHEMLASFENFYSKWLPVFSSRPSSSKSTTVGDLVLSDAATCTAVHSALQLGVGYLLPMAILFVEETNSRYTFAENFPVECPIRPNYFNLMVRHLLVVPFEAFVCLQAIILSLQTMQAFGWTGN